MSGKTMVVPLKPACEGSNQKLKIERNFIFSSFQGTNPNLAPFLNQFPFVSFVPKCRGSKPQNPPVWKCNLQTTLDFSALKLSSFIKYGVQTCVLNTIVENCRRPGLYVSLEFLNYSMFCCRFLTMPQLINESIIKKPALIN